MASFARHSIAADELTQRSLENLKRVSQAQKSIQAAADAFRDIPSADLTALRAISLDTVKAYVTAVDSRAEAMRLAKLVMAEVDKFETQYAEIVTEIDKAATDNPNSTTRALVKERVALARAELAEIKTAAAIKVDELR